MLVAVLCAAATGSCEGIPTPSGVGVPEQSPRCADLCSAESRCSVNRGGEAAAAVSVLSAAEAVESARTGAPLLSVDIFAVGLEADRGERRSGVYPAPLGVGCRTDAADGT